MKATWALFRKNLLDARWMLLTISLSLFGLSWLFVHVAHRIEVRMKAVTGGGPPTRMLRALGGTGDGLLDGGDRDGVLEPPVRPPDVRRLGDRARLGQRRRRDRARDDGPDPVPPGHPFRLFKLPGRRRPVRPGPPGGGDDRRATWWDALQHPGRPPVGLVLLRKPALNLVAFGFAIYGYTLFCSTVDLVRWRPNLIASVATLAGFIAQVVANIPSLEEYKWLEQLLDLQGLQPGGGRHQGGQPRLQRGILALIGLIGLVLGYACFLRRDLPAGS